MEPLPACSGPFGVEATQASPSNDEAEAMADIVPIFEALYQTERDAMVRLAMTIVDDGERAGEIVHDAFEKLYLRWSKVREPGAYLRAAVVNGCRSELRRRAVLRRQAPARSNVTELPVVDDAVVIALHTLPARQRIAITLRFYSDLPEAQIAETMNVRPGTVRSLISRGLAALRTTLPKEPS